MRKNRSTLLDIIATALISQAIVYIVLISVYYTIPHVHGSYKTLSRYLLDILFYPYIIVILLLLGYVLFRRFRAVVSIGVLCASLVAYNIISVNNLTVFGNVLFWVLFCLAILILFIGYISRKFVLHWAALLLALCCFILAVSAQLLPRDSLPEMLLKTPVQETFTGRIG